MPKITIMSPVSQSDDAGFRAWWQDLRTVLSAIGLVQTADTGQLDPLTMVRPATNAFAGYETWRFDDALQSVAPIILRIRPGVSAAVTRPVVDLTVGQETDGAGNLVGVKTQTFVAANNQEFSSGTAAVRSRGCGGPGFAWLLLKERSIAFSSPHPIFGFCIERTVDNNGAPTALGFAVRFRNQATSNSAVGCQQYRFITPAAVSATAENVGASMAFVPRGMTDTKTDPATGGVGLDPQVFLQWYAMNAQRPLIAWATYSSADIAADVEFDIALVGTTPRHYVTLGGDGGSGGPVANIHMNCALWED